jgi:hypothetical protein
MVRIFFLAVTLTAPTQAQDLRERSLETQKREMQAERQEREKERPDLSRPFEVKRDERACESARVNYQVSCGSPVAPKYRSPACKDAEIFIRQNC